jgi:hypothetical protein
MLGWQILAWFFTATLGAGGVWLLYRALLQDRSRGRRRCPRCWYDLEGVTGGVCTECGRAIVERKVHRTRRYSKQAAAGLALLAAACIVWRVPYAVRQGSWWALAPMPVMVLVLQFNDEKAVDTFERLCGAGAVPRGMSRSDRILAALVCDRVLRTPTPPGPNIDVTQIAFYRQFPNIPNSTRVSEQRLVSLERKLEAIQVVAALRSDAWPALEGLARASSEPTLKPQVLRALAQIGAAGGPMLVDLLHDKRPEIRKGALRAIIDSGAPQSAEVVRASARLLSDAAGDVRTLAVRALGTARGAARPHLPKLAELLKSDPDVLGVRHDCIVAAGKIDNRTGAALPLFTAALADPHDFIRLAALGKIRRLGALGRPAAEAVERCARGDPSLSIRAAAERALEAMR